MNYLLLHGSWHGAWCWDLLVPLLRKQGHVVFCSDLPGSGNDAHNAPKIIYKNLQAHVMHAISIAPEPLVVVAHSFAGLPAFYACEKFHEKIAHVFYLASWLPEETKSLVDRAVGYNNSQLPSIFIECEDKRLRALDTKGSKNLFYHDCSILLQEWASNKIRPKAAQPDNEKMPTIFSRYTLKKSSYILCTKDRVVNPISQLDMAKRFGFLPSQVKELDSGHSPFLSKPKDLAFLLRNYKDKNFPSASH